MVAINRLVIVVVVAVLLPRAVLSHSSQNVVVDGEGETSSSHSSQVQVKPSELLMKSSASLANASSKFAIDFLNNLSPPNALADNATLENVVFSPVSLQSILNMLILGSAEQSQTSKELHKILNYPVDFQASELHQMLRNLFDSMTGESGRQANSSSAAQLLSHFSSANMILANSDKIKLEPKYVDEVSRYYNVKVELFSPGKSANSNGDAAEALERSVNDWAKESTNNQIVRLVSRATDFAHFDQLIALVMNAAHFKGRWMHSFSPKATQRLDFFNSDGSEEGKAKSSKFMRQKGRFGYVDLRRRQKRRNDTLTGTSGEATDSSNDDDDIGTSCNSAHKSCERLAERLDAQVLMLPFATKEAEIAANSTTEKARDDDDADVDADADTAELSMIVLLPRERNGLARLQRALGEEVGILAEVYEKLDERKRLVQVEMPKFAFETPLDAKAALSRMGLSSLFGDGAQLDRMFGPSAQSLGAKVDNIIHKAKISVDESGAEAAAVSIAVISARTYPPPAAPTVFSANRPFIFVIRHRPSNMALFVGRLSQL